VRWCGWYDDCPHSVKKIPRQLKILINRLKIGRFSVETLNLSKKFMQVSKSFVLKLSYFCEEGSA